MIVLEIATKAIEFYNYQKNTESQYQEQENKNMKEECARIESDTKIHLQEANKKIKALTRQLEKERKEREKEVNTFTQKKDPNSFSMRLIKQEQQTFIFKII